MRRIWRSRLAAVLTCLVVAFAAFAYVALSAIEAAQEVQERGVWGEQPEDIGVIEGSSADR